MRCSDGQYYVVKFRNNPQHVRILANEYLGSKIGIFLGLPMPEARIIEVSEWLSENSPDLKIELGVGPVPCASGLQLGSRYVADPLETAVFDYLPEAMLNQIIRLAAFQNPEFYKTQAMRLSTWDKPRIISCAEEFAHHIALPRGCLQEVSELLHPERITSGRNAPRAIPAAFRLAHIVAWQAPTRSRRRQSLTPRRAAIAPRSSPASSAGRSTLSIS